MVLLVNFKYSGLLQVVTFLTLQSFTAHDGNFMTATPGAGRMPSTRGKVLSSPSHVDGAGLLHGAGRGQGRTQQPLFAGGLRAWGESQKQAGTESREERKTECKAGG